MHFLNEQRRNELISQLMQISMPVDMARRHATYSDHLPTLDKLLSELVARLIERSVRFRQMTNVEQRRNFEAFFKADMYILSAYTGEASDRHIPGSMLPKTTRAIGAATATVAELGSLKRMH